MRTIDDDGLRIPDYIWEEMKLIIPKPIDNHPLGCHKLRIEDRIILNGILFVLRTGIQWKGLDFTNICKHSVAHDRFQEWTIAGVFEEFWRRGLLMYQKNNVPPTPKGVDLQALVFRMLGKWTRVFENPFHKWNGFHLPT